MRHITLSPRLAAIASLVPRGASIADVGTDHGGIPLYLLQNDVISDAIATDINPGPLSVAIAAAGECELSDCVSFILCDGLEKVQASNVDTVIIAGMGGENIIGILEKAPWTLENDRLLILQPMSRQEVLRRWLYENGFVAKSESLVKDFGTIYSIITASGGADVPYLTDAELALGHYDLIKNDALFKEYLAFQLKRTGRAIAGMKDAKSGRDKLRLERSSALHMHLEEMMRGGLA